jgi:tetratricopeptide (TPR) repeat protein
VKGAAPLLLLCLAAGSLRAGEAQVSLDPAASVSQPWLTIDTDPRSAAMGDAFVAVADSPYALAVNPAGLDLLFEPELSFTHNEWDSALGIRQETLNFGRRAGDGGVGFAFNYISYGSFDNRDANGAPLDSSTDQSFAGSAGYASGFLADQLHLGLNLGASQTSLGSSVSTLYTAGLGGLYQIFPSLRLGASLLNLGLNQEDGNAPTEFHVGADWQPLHQALLLSAEYVHPQNGDSSSHFGLEWNFLEAYSLRGGWRLGSADGVDNGFSVGAGVKLGDFSFDYAYVPYGDFSLTQRIGLTVQLSEGLFGSKIVIEGYGQTQTAAADYAEGMQAFGARDWYTAKVSLNHVLKLYPSFDKADQVRTTLADIEKKIAADKSHGLTPEARQKIAQDIADARKLIDQGEIAQAKKKLETVLEYDKSLKEALTLLSQINQTISTRVAGFKQEAFAALSIGDIRTAVLKYRAVLKVDDEDIEARTRLAKLRPRIFEETKKMHREGIDAYVTGDVQKAIQIWSDALELDPTDPQDLKRDLDKAKKLLELKASN